MKFFATNGIRPIRLSEATRRFAMDSLQYRYGREALNTPEVVLQPEEYAAAASSLERQDLAIEKIAREAPLRICEGELLSGAATLGKAIEHVIPARFEGRENAYYPSVSHLTIDFEMVLKQGVDAIQRKAEDAWERYRGTEKEAFIKSCLACLGAMRHWHGRYLEQLASMEGYEKNYQNLLRVPFAPASDFYEAVQSLWFTFAFVRLCGNWPGIGRIDWLLGEYLERDLAEGKLSLEQAREILAHFFIKGCEWITGRGGGSGDAQHYQNIVLGGVDENGKEVTNTVTYLVLEVLEELGISDFPTTVRVNQNTSQKLLTRVAEGIRLGGGVLAVYNEDLILKSLTDSGYSQKEARKFANDGCWEVQIPGKTFFIYRPFDALGILQSKTLKGYEAEEVGDFDSLCQAFSSDVKQKVREILVRKNESSFETIQGDPKDWKWKPTAPCTVVSLFEEGCLEQGLSYWEGGPVYNVYSPHIGGLPDAVNSLYAIKKLVFDEKKLSFSRLMQVLKEDWQGEELLRRYALNHYRYYGNDNDEADAIYRQILSEFCSACEEFQQESRYRTPAGVSTFGRQLEWSPQRFATPYGKKAHEILAANCSPTPGTDREGATAIIKSYCKADLSRTVSGAALDLKLLPSAVNGEGGLEALVALMRGFVMLGGFFLQLDVADRELLKQAQEHPEDYQNLSVRVSGWNARFVTLHKKWQDMILEQGACSWDEEDVPPQPE